MTASHRSKAEACAELDALHPRHGKHVLCHDALGILAQIRGTKARRYSADCAFHRTAYAVDICLGCKDDFLDLCIGGMLHSAQQVNAACNGNASLCQQLLCHRTRKYKGRCQSSGKVSATTVVGKAAVTHRCGEVRMTGTRQVLQLGIVLAAGVGIFNTGTQGCTRGFAFKYPRQNFHRIRFLAGGRGLVTTGRTASHLRSHRIHIQRQPRGQAGDHHTDGRAVRFTENCIADHKLPSLRMAPPSFS